MFLYQPTSGYCYNSDSIFLYDFISKYKPKGKLLDVGCGVGIISLLLGRDFNIETTIIDKQKVMLDYATMNFRLNSLEVKSYLEDFEKFETKDRFDFIISNPPFYSPDVRQSKNTHINIARYSHHLPIKEFIYKVKSILTPRGYFLFCYDAKQVDILLFYLKEVNLNVERLEFVYSKLDRESKLVMIGARNSSKSMTQVLSPFIVFNDNNEYTSRAKDIFNRADTHSIKGDFEEQK